MSRIASPRPRSSSRFLARVLPGAKPAPLSGFIEPCLASLSSKVPSGHGFLHEIKLDVFGTIYFRLEEWICRGVRPV